VIPNYVYSINQPLKYINKWTKDRPIDNVIGNPSRPVSTRHQLQDEAINCNFHAFISSVEPNSYKEALMESCWIESMQEELNEFKRLKVWELVPRPNHAMIITLKWIYKISQSLRGIFLRQSKYALESLKNYGMETYDLVDTPMVEKSNLDEDPQGKAVDPTRYHGMIDTLMYLTSSTPDIVFAMCMCARCGLARFQKKYVYKYAAIRHHFIKEQVEDGVVELYFVRTEYQLADIFTKPLARERLEFLINKLGMRSMSFETLKKLADEEEE
nr:hypothetical protein [Tanacetum cinerariifolium]